VGHVVVVRGDAVHDDGILPVLGRDLDAELDVRALVLVRQHLADVVEERAAHHDDVPHESEISVLVQAADAISGSRPGARREAFETYVKRLEGLEKIASSYRGVEKVFAIQAGREVRVIVLPDDVDDTRMTSLTDEIARRIEAELQYPGQIKVVVIRETRAVDFAR
jgi:ribonuclease Y